MLEMKTLVFILKLCYFRGSISTYDRLMGNAVAFKYPDNLMLLPMYPKAAMMYIYCPDDVCEARCWTCVPEAQALPAIGCSFKEDS